MGSAIRGADGTGRAAVLHALRGAGAARTADQLAHQVGLAVTTVRFHLDRLVADGLVRPQTEPRAGRPGRPHLLYRSLPVEAVDPGAAYRLLAGLLAARLGATEGLPGSLRVGQEWADAVLAGRPGPYREHRPDQVAAPVGLGDRAAAGAATGGTATGGADDGDAVQALVRMLEDAGFAPWLPAGGTTVELHACPFLELAREQAEVVCTVHLGLVRGLLARWGGPARARLTPVLDGSGPCRLALT